MDTTYVIYNQMTSPNIKHTYKNKDIMDYDIYNTYSEKKTYINNNPSKNEFLNKIKNIDIQINSENYVTHILGISDIPYLNILHGADLTYYGLHEYDKLRDGHITRNLMYSNAEKHATKKYTEKHNFIVDTMAGKEVYELMKDKLPCERPDIRYKYQMKTISLLFDYLNVGGKFYMAHTCVSKQYQVEMTYLLSFMFERVIIFDAFLILCENFLGDRYVSKHDVVPLISNKFTISNKIDEDKYIKYTTDVYKYYIKLYDYYLSDKVDEYIELAVYSIYKKMLLMNPSSDNVLFVHKLIIDVLRRVMVDNTIVKVNSCIKSQEGNFISEIIQRYKCKSCLEVGMAFGVSAMYILSSDKNTTLISIDPFQSTQWNNSGRKLMKMIGVSSRHKLIEEKSFIALPALLKKYKFDFIFIDGWHTFDYTLIDFFYSLELLNDDGIIIIDDALHKGVSKCVKYIETNYPHCRKLVSPHTVACFKKVKKDTRDWNFHVNF